MFCGKCGNELKPEAKFCPKCGCAVAPVQAQASGNMETASAPIQATVTETVDTAAAVTVKPKKKLSKGKKVFIGVAAVLVLIILISALGGRGSSGKNTGGLDEDEILSTMKELPLSNYIGVSSADLFSTIGATAWKLGGVSGNTATATVTGNGMTFEVVLNTDSMTYKVNSAVINGAAVSGQACDAMCESLLSSAYEACKAGYYG